MSGPGLATRAVRAGIDRDAAFGAVVPPLVLSSNFSFEGSPCRDSDIHGNVIAGVWDELNFTVLGETRTLDYIEHRILRTEFDEPRISTLPRLVLEFDMKHYGRLRQLIDRLNDLG